MSRHHTNHDQAHLGGEPFDEAASPGRAVAATAALSPPTRRRRTMRQLASDAGQGTVEYVGLLLLMATVLAGVVGVAGKLDGQNQIGKKVVTNISKSIDQAGGGR